MSTNNSSSERVLVFSNLNVFRTFGRLLGLANRNILLCTWTQGGVNTSPWSQAGYKYCALIRWLLININIYWCRYIIGKDLSFVHTFLLGPFLYLLVSVLAALIALNFSILINLSRAKRHPMSFVGVILPFVCCEWSSSSIPLIVRHAKLLLVFALCVRCTLTIPVAGFLYLHEPACATFPPVFSSCGRVLRCCRHVCSTES